MSGTQISLSDHVDGALLERAAAALERSGHRLVTAESCTGGLVAASLTSLAGSSEFVEGGFVTYRLTAKEDMVGVTPALLRRHGAVSEPVARAMSEGALHASRGTLSVAITGVAGPTGGDVSTPVGTVWFAWALRESGQASEVRCVQTAAHHLPGDRAAVRGAAVNVALTGVLALLE